jgi:hypothetical protein
MSSTNSTQNQIIFTNSTMSLEEARFAWLK